MELVVFNKHRTFKPRATMISCLRVCDEVLVRLLLVRNGRVVLGITSNHPALLFMYQDVLESLHLSP